MEKHLVRSIQSVSFVLVLGALAACSHSDDDDDTPSGQALVNSLIQDNTTDSAEPVDLNDLDLQFSEDEGAFDAYFQ